MTITIPRYKSFLYRQVFKITSYYSTGEPKKLKCIGYIHSDSESEWRKKPDIEIAFLSTTKKDKITINIIGE